MHRDIALFLQNYGWLTAELTWLIYATAAAVAVHTETSGLRLSRHRYAINAVFRAVGSLVLFQLGIMVLDTFPPTPGGSFAWRIAFIMIVVTLFIGATAVVFVRIVVQRLRDGGIARKWAYLMLLPGMCHLLMLGLVLYPPSRAPGVSPARITQIIRGPGRQAVD